MGRGNSAKITPAKVAARVSASRWIAAEDEQAGGRRGGRANHVRRMPRLA